MEPFLQSFALFERYDGSWRKINASWVIWARESDVARHVIPRELKGNITDDPSRRINKDV